MTYTHHKLAAPLNTWGVSVIESGERSVIPTSADGDCGFTLVELMVTMVLTAILLTVVIAPLNTVTNVTGSTVFILQATASARAVFQDMNAGVTSASQICLPTQLTSTQTATPGAAVRVKTNVFGTVKWEQWWLNPSTNQLLAQSWTTAAPSPTSWRTVANNVSPVSPSPSPLQSSVSTRWHPLPACSTPS